MILMTLIGLLAGCSAASTAPAEAPTLPAQAAETGFVADGKMLLVADATVSFERAGTIAEILVAEGDAVTASQPLARLDTRALADGATLPLRVRLRFATTATDLHGLRWETLFDLLTGTPLAVDTRTRLVRTLERNDTRPMMPVPRPLLRTLLVLANPSDLGHYGDVHEER